MQMPNEYITNFLDNQIEVKKTLTFYKEETFSMYLNYLWCAMETA